MKRELHRGQTGYGTDHHERLEMEHVLGDKLEMEHVQGQIGNGLGPMGQISNDTDHGEQIDNETECIRFLCSSIESFMELLLT